MDSNGPPNSSSSSGMPAQELRNALLQAQRERQPIPPAVQAEILRRMQGRIAIPAGSCISFRKLNDGRMQAQVKPPSRTANAATAGTDPLQRLSGGAFHDDGGQQRRPLAPGVLQLIAQQLNARFQLPPFARVEIFQLGQDIHAHVIPQSPTTPVENSNETVVETPITSGEVGSDSMNNARMSTAPSLSESEPLPTETSTDGGSSATLAASTVPVPQSSDTAPLQTGETAESSSRTTNVQQEVTPSTVTDETTREEMVATNANDDSDDRSTDPLVASQSPDADEESSDVIQNESNNPLTRSLRLQLPTGSVIRLATDTTNSANTADGTDHVDEASTRRNGPVVTLRLGNGDQPTAAIRMGPGISFGESRSLHSEINLPDLVPLIAPDSQQDICSQIEMQHDKERFTCGICYEFLDNPSSCGRCAGRFCRECLRKVMQQAGNRSTPKLCPICRNPIDKIQQDAELLREMQEAGQILCRFHGCGARISLAGVKHHERHHCPRVRVLCRYHSFGCRWKGLRGNLSQHEENCPLAKVSGLVREHRIIQEQLQRVSRELGGRVHALGHVVNYQRDMIRRFNMRSPTNPTDIAAFALTALCSGSLLIQTKDVWSNMYGSPKARAAVFNALTLCPTFLLLSKILLTEYTRCFAILREGALNIESGDGLDVFLDSTICLFAASVAALLIMVCFLVDYQSSEQWSNYKFPFLKEERPFVFYVTALAFFLSYSLAFDIIGGFYTSAFVGFNLLLASTLLPATIACFSCKMAQANTPKLVESTGRSALPLLFGLRYAFVGYILGILTCIDTLCVIHLIDQNRDNKLSRATLGHKELFTDIPIRGYLASLYAVIRVANSLAQPGENPPTSECFFLLGGVALIVLLNLLISRLNAVFASAGTYIHQCVSDARIRSPVEVPIPAASAVLSVWTLSIVVLLTT